VQYVGVLSDPISFRVKFALSEQDVNKLKGVEAKFAEVKSREDLAKDVCLTVIENK
jgi:phage FluMu protein gp41